MVEAWLRLRYTEGGLRAEEFGAMVSNPGARREGGGALAVSAQNRHLHGEAEGLGYFILRWSRCGLMGRQYPWACRFWKVWVSKPSPPYLGLQRPG